MRVNARIYRALPRRASPTWGLRRGRAPRAAHASSRPTRTEAALSPATTSHARPAFRFAWPSSTLLSIPNSLPSNGGNHGIRYEITLRHGWRRASKSSQGRFYCSVKMGTCKSAEHGPGTRARRSSGPSSTSRASSGPHERPAGRGRVTVAVTRRNTIYIVCVVSPSGRRLLMSSSNRP